MTRGLGPTAPSLAGRNSDSIVAPAAATLSTSMPGPCGCGGATRRVPGKNVEACAWYSLCRKWRPANASKTPATARPITIFARIVFAPPNLVVPVAERPFCNDRRRAAMFRTDCRRDIAVLGRQSVDEEIRAALRTQVSRCPSSTPMRLPLLPTPYLDETFGSWLSRAAADYHTEVEHFARAVLRLEGKALAYPPPRSAPLRSVRSLLSNAHEF